MPGFERSSQVRSFLLFFSFFLPFRLSHLRPIKIKNQGLGQRIGCCGFVNFLGASRMLMNFLGLCFKLRIEVVVVGIGGWRKKKECLGWSLWFWESIGGWREKEMNSEWYEMMKWCEAGRLTRMSDMVLRYGPTKSRKNWVIRSWKHVPNGWV